MTDYETYVTQLPEAVPHRHADLGESQAKLIEAVRAVPASAEIKQPSATEVVEQSFDFRHPGVLDAQRDLTLRLIKATSVTPAKDRRQAGRLIAAVGMS